MSNSCVEVRDFLIACEGRNLRLVYGEIVGQAEL